MQLKKISQDLSRRLDVYKLKPLSFKEYLILKYNIKLNLNLKLKDFLGKDKKKVFLELSKIKFKLPNNIFSLYKKYYKNQFPFLLEEKEKKDKIYQLVEKVIYKDIPLIDNMYSKYLKYVEIIIKFLSYSEKVNYTNISRNLGIKKDLIIKIIDLLEKSELLYIVDDILPTRQLRSNRKILFSSPALRFSLNNNFDNKIIGFSREDAFGLILKIANLDFFYNYKQNGFDYLVNNQKFEVGNNKKNMSKDVIVISDILDVEYKKEVLFVPLYLFALIEE
jgi:predicted AAA+ superfamily ATPase